jgi:hypothetical protein
MTGRIIADPFVETVKNGEAKALFAPIKLQTGETRTVQLFPGINADRWPCKNDVVVVERSGGLLYAAAAWDGEEPKLKPGELEIYSRDPKRKRVGRIYLDNKGNIVINADAYVEIKGHGTLLGADVLIEFFTNLKNAVTSHPIKIPSIPLPPGAPLAPVPPMIVMFLKFLCDAIAKACDLAIAACKKVLT